MLSDSVDASFYRSWRCKYRYSECDEEQDNYDTQKSKESKEETKNINDKFHNVANKLPTVKYHSIFNKRGLIFSPQSILSESNLNSVATQFQSNIENMMVNYSYPLVGIRKYSSLIYLYFLYLFYHIILNFYHLFVFVI